MKLTVIGSSPAPATPDIQSGYLLEFDNKTILVDAGSGVANELEKLGKIKDLTDIFITHTHADHILDLIAIGYSLRFIYNKSINLHIHKNHYAKLTNFFEVVGAANLLEKVFQLTEYDNKTNDIYNSQYKFSYAKVNHAEDFDTYALRFEYNNKSVVFGTDCQFNEDLIKLANNCDLLLCEATMLEQEDNLGVHMNIKQALEITKQSKAKELLLIHIYPLLEKTAMNLAKEKAKELDLNVNITFAKSKAQFQL